MTSGRPTPEAQRGLAHVGELVDSGKDPNADLDRPHGDTATRSQAALTMKLAGASYSEIAQQLGYSSAWNARTAVERVLAESADSDDDRAKMRELTTRRLERLLKSVMPKAVDPRSPEHLAYNARALAIIDREARLHGIDAPTQAVVVTPAAERVEQYVATVLALARKDGEAAEQEIVEAELED